MSLHALQQFRQFCRILDDILQFHQFFLQAYLLLPPVLLELGLVLLLDLGAAAGRKGGVLAGGDFRAAEEGVGGEDGLDVRE